MDSFIVAKNYNTKKHLHFCKCFLKYLTYCYMKKYRKRLKEKIIKWNIKMSDKLNFIK